MTHAKDLCTCGHRRADHKNGEGVCRHRHAPACAAFELKQAHVVLTEPAHRLLLDLKDTNEPLRDISAAAAQELHDLVFVKYYTSNAETWVSMADRGRTYIQDNPIKPETGYRELGHVDDD